MAGDDRARGLLPFLAQPQWHQLIYEKGLAIQTNIFWHHLLFAGRITCLSCRGGLALALLIVLGLTLAGAVKRTHAERVEVLAIYWHFVDAIWVVVFTVVYIIGR